MPAVAQILDEVEGGLVQLHRRAAGQVVVDLAVVGPQAQALGLRTAEDAGGGIEARDTLHVAAAYPVGLAEVEAHVIVDVLQVHVDGAAADVVPDGQTELAAVIEVEARIPGAALGPVEAAHGHAPVADRAAVPKVGAEQAVVADGHLREALGYRTGLAGDVVDEAARRVGREHRRRAAPDHLDLADGLVQPEGLVRIQVAKARIVLDRHAVLGQLDRRIAVHRNAAGADIGAGFTARILHPEARHIAEAVGDAADTGQAKALLWDDADGIAGVGPVAHLDPGPGGDHHGVDGGGGGRLGIDVAPDDDGVGIVARAPRFEAGSGQQQPQGRAGLEVTLDRGRPAIGGGFAGNQDIDIGLAGKFRDPGLGRLGIDGEAVRLGRPGRNRGRCRNHRGHGE